MITPYLTFNGDCAKAIEFYAEALDGKVEDVLKFGQAPTNPNYPMPESAKNLIMQATIKVGGMHIRLSDCFPGQPYDKAVGDKITFALRPNTEADGKKLFEKLSKGGKITRAPEKTFFSSFYACVTDIFGIKWQIAAE